MGGLRRAEKIEVADGIAVTIGNDGVARLPGEEFTLFAPKSPPTPQAWEHQQMIVEITRCTRDNVRLR